jgi:hypothetical protein
VRQRAERCAPVGAGVGRHHRIDDDDDDDDRDSSWM